MGDLLEYSLEFLVLVPLHPMFWAGLVVIGFVAHGAGSDAEDHPQSTPKHSRLRWFSELTLLLVAPVSLLAMGRLFSLASHTIEPERDRLVFLVLAGLAAIQAIVVAWLIWRHRERTFATAIFSVLAAGWTVAAHVVAGMAATDNWL